MRRDRFLGLYAQFDPKLILLQMVCNQLVYYSGLVFFYLIFDFSFGLHIHIGQFFHHSIYDTGHMYGTICILANFLNIFIVIVGMIFITEKANKVLDFAFTVYFIHFMICLFYNKRFWLSWSWLITNGIFMTITIFLGEYVLMKIEQQEIRLFDNLMMPTENSNGRVDSIGIELNNKSTLSDKRDLLKTDKAC